MPGPWREPPHRRRRPTGAEQRERAKQCRPNNDEYRADLSANGATVGPLTFGVLFRVSLDGGLNYTYCDADDNNDGFDPTAAAPFTVTP